MGRKKDDGDKSVPHIKHAGGNPSPENDRNNRKLRMQGMDPNAAYCTTCNVWYDLGNLGQVQAHTHEQ